MALFACNLWPAGLTVGGQVREGSNVAGRFTEDRVWYPAVVNALIPGERSIAATAPHCSFWGGPQVCPGRAT
jgi:hypothetical protein